MLGILKFFLNTFLAVLLISIVFVFSTLWYFSNDLPDYKILANYEPSVSSRMHSGEGILIAPAAIDSAFAYVSKVPDQSNLLITTEPKSEFTYYAGFAWEKSGDVSSKEDWIEILKKQAKIIKSPLKLSLE